MGFQPGPSAAGSFYSRPSSSLGFWRGSGSNAGVSGLGGNEMAGTSSGIFAAPTVPGAGGWEPSVLYLLILIVAEMFVFGFIARTLR
jgi:hypothetical protein